uniref:titin-like isoform X2 n=1 Tax=Oncorhynchus gorbuscha TaxID=8017 RepID=UPI001EAEB354|nr:titin-like isoform X2 [Oncorhynchus gorbuscha]
MRRLRRKGGNNEKVFGCDLLDHLSTTCQEIPQVLRSCSEFIEEHGVVDGIYRLSGVSSNTQKLRGEFDSEGTPDLNKDVYLQDIHCVSSVCKAYFRELPNPLLTYQLYDKYAEAVAIQLEEERLVKIKDVLKELPAPHYKTLEFLMRHLVKMASHSSHTNMHSRNLAIVWAPNLLRSKDIEASGFNGTAAFMEVRVQSIVVEFILTHVPQLFPDSGITERRKSLPSPSIHNPEEPFFRAIPFQLGNISPGDGPPAMRSYHAIIDGTDKRKGSLKGRKWKSIFNLGGRLHDPRRRNKNSAKEKERTVLRPAKSMDSLSSVPYPQEGSRQRPPSTVMSPLAQPSPCTQGVAEGGASSSGGDMGSGYAVTYRRGQGASVSVVSGGGGTQGIYSRLDSHCGGGNSTEALQPPSRSPGLSSKADRRAGIHISGPFSVTVPLHITSGLAFGVLQGGGADRGNHRGGQESGDKGEGGEGDRRKGREGERQKAREGHRQEAREGDRQEGGEGERHIRVEVKREDKTDLGKRRDEEVTGERRGEAEEDKVEEKWGRGEEEREEEVNGDCVSKPSEESIEEILVQGEGGEGDAENHDNDEGEYMDMKGSVQTALDAPDMSGVRNEVVAIDLPFPLMEEDDEQDQDCPLDFQDTFGFLDLMDSSVSSQMFQEFSVEPHHGGDEYEDEVEHRSPGLSHDRPDPVTQPPVDTQTQIQTQTPIHRPLSIDQYGRANKSMSLPYMSRPFLPALSSSSSEEEEEDEEGDDYDKEDEEDDDDMFCKSLPSSLVFNRLTWSGPQTDLENSLSPAPVPSQPLDGASDDGPISSSEARIPPEHLDIDSPDCCHHSVEVLRYSKAEEKNSLEAMKLVEEEDAEQDRGNQEKNQADTLTNTCTESTDIEERCHLVETSIMEEEETPDHIEKSHASASASTDCEEASLQTTGVHLKLKDEEEVLKSQCPEEGVISEGYHGDTVSEADAENPQEHLLAASLTVSCAEEPENIVNERSEEVSRDSAGDVKEHPEKSAKRERAGEEKKVEEVMEERDDRNGGGWDKQEGEETACESEGDMGKREEREVLKELEKTEENYVGVRVGVEEKEQGGMIEEEDDRIAGDEREVGEEDTKQEELIYEEMMSIVVRDDMMESGECKDREGKTEGSTFIEEVIETKEDGEMIGVQQKEIMKEINESKASEEMSAKEEAKKAVEGVDPMGETEEEAAEGVDTMGETEEEAAEGVDTMGETEEEAAEGVDTMGETEEEAAEGVDPMGETEEDAAEGVDTMGETEEEAAEGVDTMGETEEDAAEERVEGVDTMGETEEETAEGVDTMGETEEEAAEGVDTMGETEEDAAEERVEGVDTMGETEEEAAEGVDTMGETEEEAAEGVDTMGETEEDAAEERVEGVDTMGETEEEAAEERVEKMLIYNEKQDLEAQHVLERRQRDIDLIKDVVGEGYEEGEKEIEVGDVIWEEEGDSIRVVQWETDEKKGEMKDQLKTPTIEEREEELKEIQINNNKKYEGENKAMDSKVGSEKGVGRVLVVSKQQTPPKVYQARSVPVVPPKPHHCRITALNLRQQQHQRERRETDRDSGKGKVHRTLGQQDKERKMEGKPEHDKVSKTERGWNEDGEDEGTGKKEAQSGGVRERRRDVDEGGVKDMMKNSPVSMCFDEAVAMGIKRGREKEGSEREKKKERGYEVQ